MFKKFKANVDEYGYKNVLLFKLKNRKNLITSILVILVMIASIVLAIESRPDINSMDSVELYQELDEIKGIGEVLATRIVEGRPYVSFNQLQNNITGIGDEITDRIKSKFNLRKIEE